MILSYRRTSIPELGAQFATRAIVHPSYRLHVVDNRRVTGEDALLSRAVERKGRTDRPVLTMVLAGRARVRAFGRERWLEPGAISLVGRKAGIELRHEGDAFRSLVLEWDGGGAMGEALPEALDTSLLGDLLARAQETATVLLARDLTTSGAAAAVCGLLQLLAALGVPLRRASPEELIAPASPQDQRLAAALDAALSDLARQPMMPDLDRVLGLSARHTARVVESFNARYGFNASGWGDARTRARVLLGASFMATRGATTELVARRVGYRSPSAFCRALRAAGLPSPGQMRDAVRALS